MSARYARVSAAGYRQRAASFADQWPSSAPESGSALADELFIKNPRAGLTRIIRASVKSAVPLSWTRGKCSLQMRGGANEGLDEGRGNREIKGERSEVLGDLQIPSSLVALAPSLSISFSPMPGFRGSFPTFRVSSCCGTYTNYMHTLAHVYAHACTHARACARCGMIARDGEMICAALSRCCARVFKRLGRFTCTRADKSIQINPSLHC